MKNLIDSITLSLLRNPAIETLGWALLHFVWQGVLIALILAALLWLLKNLHPSLRYLISCISLVLMLLCPIVTYRVLDAQRPRSTTTIATSLPVQTDQLQAAQVTDNQPVEAVTTPVVFAPEGSSGTKKSWLERYLRPYLPYLVIFWGIGVLVLSIRLLGGLWYLRKLRTQLTKPVSNAIMSQLSNVAERLGLARTVQLRESMAVTVPLVIGWIKPMILLPSSAISGLSVKQLEMILAHELAHIRRHDYLVNLLQSIIETLLFYHPAVWWVSHRIRVEREHCCDDLAVKVCGGDKQSYAQALADLDDLRPTIQLAQAASGGSLLKRILRLADKTITKSLDPRQWLAGLSMISVSLVLFILVGASFIFAQGDEVTLRLALADQVDALGIAPYVNEFIEQVKILSNNKITIEPFYRAGDDTEIGYEAGVIEHVTRGDFELGLAASRSWDTAGITNLQALQAPFLIDNDALAEVVATSDTATTMLESLSSVGVVGLTFWPEQLRHPFAFEQFGKAFLSPEDFVGTTIRINESHLTRVILETLGATSIFKDNFGQDVIEGRIQGAESGVGGAFISLPTLATATGNVTFFPKYQVLFANGSSFERLSDEQQSILREAAVAAQKKAIAERWQDSVAATIWCDNGGRIVLASEEQLAAFEKAVQSVYAQLEQDPVTAQYIAAIRDLKANTIPSAGAAVCASEVASETSTDANSEVWDKGLPPNGIWQVELTASDLEKVEIGRWETVGFANKSDWKGIYTLTLQDGKATWEKPGLVYCKATYELVEDTLRFSYAYNDCGNREDNLQWRLGDDGLQLNLVDTKNASLQNNKVLLGLKPWQKIGEPSVDTTLWEKGLPPNGKWKVELSPEDFARMGVVRSWGPDWAGTYTFEFQDGKGALLYSGPTHNLNSAICEMHYELDGDISRFIYTSGASCLNITEFHRWRLDDEGLHLHLLDIANAPFYENRAVYEAKPWQKVE